MKNFTNLTLACLCVVAKNSCTVPYICDEQFLQIQVIRLDIILLNRVEKTGFIQTKILYSLKSQKSQNIFFMNYVIMNDSNFIDMPLRL